MRNVDTIILCGGLGTRLRSVCKDKPKALVNVGEKPFLDNLIGYLSGFGLKRFILAIGYKADLIKSYYCDNNSCPEIVFSYEKEQLGTGGAVLNALPYVKSGSFFVLNGDSFCEFDVRGMLEYHVQKKAFATMLIRSVDNSSDYGNIELDTNGRIAGFKEKHTIDGGYINAGVYIFSEDIEEKIPDKKNISLEKDVFPLLTNEEFYAFKSDGYFVDIGTPERYRKACEYFNKGGKDFSKQD